MAPERVVVRPAADVDVQREARAPRAPAPGVEADGRVTRLEVVAEVIAAVAAADEQRPEHALVRHGVRRREEEGAAVQHDRREVDRGEQHAAALERVVPVTVHEQVAAGGRTVMGRHPDPVRPVADPVPGPPDVVAAPQPRPRDVEARRVRLGHARGEFERLRRGRQVFELLRGLRVLELCRGDLLPEAADPLPAAEHVAPAPGQPDAARRRDAPKAADPDEVGLLFVEVPVPGDPLDVVTLGLLVRRQFFDGARRQLLNDRPGRRHLGGRGERLVDRPAGQHFDAVRAADWLLGYCAGRDQGDCGDGPAEDAEQREARESLHDIPPRRVRRRELRRTTVNAELGRTCAVAPVGLKFSHHSRRLVTRSPDFDNRKPRYQRYSRPNWTPCAHRSDC